MGNEKGLTPNLLRSALLALLAAIVSAAAWYGVVASTHFQVGIVAVAVGWLVAQAAILGAGRLGGRQVQIIAVIATLLAMALSEYLLGWSAINTYLASQNEYLPLLTPPGIMLQVLGTSVRSDPLSLVFWLIALWEAFKLPMSRRLHVPRPTPSEPTSANLGQ